MSVHSQPRVSYPGAGAPARRRDVDAHGARIAVWEWGEEKGPPLLLAHGGFDFARTFDVFAPLLAAGGYRVVSWDHRGHGDSEHTPLYSWTADCRDALAVLDSITQEPIAAVGHSKGSNLLLDLCVRLPERFSRFVNLDGLPSTGRYGGRQRVLEERVQLRHRAIAEWLDHRRRSAGAQRRPGTLDELAKRRGRMNPRLPHEWLRYLVSVGARHDEDGWRWKIDPTLRFGGLGPWRPEAALEGLKHLRVPMLAVVAGIDEPMGWGTDVETIRPLLPEGTELVHVEDHGHFLHIEAPERMAELALRFLAGEGDGS